MFFHILGICGIFLLKVYNLSRLASRPLKVVKREGFNDRGSGFYGMGMAWVLFSAVLMFWFLGLVALSFDLVAAYATIFRFTSGFLALQVVFLVAEIFFYVRDGAMENSGGYSMPDVKF